VIWEHDGLFERGHSLGARCTIMVRTTLQPLGATHTPFVCKPCRLSMDQSATMCCMILWAFLFAALACCGGCRTAGRSPVRERCELDTIWKLLGVDDCAVCWGADVGTIWRTCRPDTFVREVGFHRDVQCFYKARVSESVPLCRFELTDGKLSRIVLHMRSDSVKRALVEYLDRTDFRSYREGGYEGAGMHIFFNSGDAPFMWPPDEVVDKLGLRNLPSICVSIVPGIPE
jgi:hypothetical protein